MSGARSHRLASFDTPEPNSQPQRGEWGRRCCWSVAQCEPPCHGVCSMLPSAPVSFSAKPRSEASDLLLLFLKTGVWASVQLSCVGKAGWLTAAHPSVSCFCPGTLCFPPLVFCHLIGRVPLLSVACNCPSHWLQSIFWGQREVHSSMVAQWKVDNVP